MTGHCFQASPDQNQPVAADQQMPIRPPPHPVPPSASEQTWSRRAGLCTLNTLLPELGNGCCHPLVDPSASSAACQLEQRSVFLAALPAIASRGATVCAARWPRSPRADVALLALPVAAVRHAARHHNARCREAAADSKHLSVVAVADCLLTALSAGSPRLIMQSASLDESRQDQALCHGNNRDCIC